MIIDAKKYSGPCTCGQVHKTTTQLAVIEAGCMKDFDDRLAQAGLSGHRTAIYDTNTYHAKGLISPRADQEIVLTAEGLAADDGATASVLQQLTGDTDILIAVGAGTIHDIVRYCAHKRGLPFVSCPTAASMDGFASSRCTMTWRGMQVTMPGVAPALVLADIDVIRCAPEHLARAGVGEALSKFTSLADWKIASLLAGTPACPVAESTIRQAAIAAHGCCALLHRGDAGSYAQLMYALLLSGMAVQMLDDATMAAGSEHMLSSLMDLLPDAYGPKESTLHGEQIGVCTTVIADLYHQLAKIDDIEPLIKPYKPLDKEWLTKQFGEELAAKLEQENAPDCLLAVDRDNLVRNWPEIRHIIAEIPEKNSLVAMLAAVGAKTTMEELSISDAKLPRMLQLAPCVRNQLTLTRTLRIIKFRYDSNSKASRAPSRKSRYADKAMMRAGKRSAVSASSMR